jgi:type II secretory pathway component HofQ
VRWALAAFLGLFAALPAAAGREACATGTRWRGKPIDVDLKAVELHEVFRLLAEVGDVNIVVSDEVKGAVTLRVTKVPWDQVLCAVARMKKLLVTIDRSVYLVTSEKRP